MDKGSFDSNLEAHWLLFSRVVESSRYMLYDEQLRDRVMTLRAHWEQVMFHASRLFGPSAGAAGKFVLLEKSQRTPGYTKQLVNLGEALFSMRAALRLLLMSVHEGYVEIDLDESCAIARGTVAPYLASTVAAVHFRRTTVALEVLESGWGPFDRGVDEIVDSNTEFYVNAHVTRLDQIFAVYYQISCELGLFWIGFTNRENDWYNRANERTRYFGQQNQMNYSFVDSIQSTVVSRLPQLKGLVLKVVCIRCRCDAAKKDEAKLYVGIRQD